MMPASSSRVVYEYPFNEGVRTMLRLEHLFDRLTLLLPRSDALDHHFALVTLFEVMDVAARADLKSDLLRELERHRSHLQAFKGNPRIAEQALDGILGRVESSLADLNAVQGKAGQALTANEWLMSIRSRIGIPGGTCEFDLPAYFAWQQNSAERRQDDLQRWAGNFEPLQRSLRLVLGLLRESGVAQRVHAPAGLFQQRLPEGRAFQLLRVQVDAASGLVPEISGHRLMVSVRLMKPEPDSRLKPTGADDYLELALCA